MVSTCYALRKTNSDRPLQWYLYIMHSGKLIQTDQFSGIYTLCTQVSPYLLQPVSLKFPQQKKEKPGGGGVLRGGGLINALDDNDDYYYY